ncbi:hypothetical protein WEI85_01935 [Actinomycetes bacterium KLBMP 9797]
MSGVKGGVPGGHFRTDWRQHDVVSMWHTIENQQGDNHWKLVSGWRRTAELTAAHLQRLVDYRSQLAAVWSPERNAAAAAYVARLDFLITSVRATHDVAAANYSTFAATVGALTSARRDLKPIYDEYVEKHQAIRSYDDLVAHSRSFEGVSPIPERPATQQDLERLNYRARAIMYDLSRTLVEAQSALKHPPTYLARMPTGSGDPDVYGASRHSPTNVSSEGSQARSTRSTSVPLTTQPIGNGHSAGAGPGAVSAAGYPPSPRLISSKQHAPASARPPTLDTRPVRQIPRARQRHGLSSDTVHSNTGESAGKSRPVLPVGGIIGAPPAAPYPSSAPHLASTTSPANRVNPVGGVIGGVIGGAQPSDPLRASQGPTNRHADDVWEVATGVAPIIQPTLLGGPINPGPVIGLTG